MNEQEFRRLLKYLEALGTEYPNVTITDFTKGQKAAYRHIRKLLENPSEYFDEQLEKALEKILNEMH